MCPALSGRRGLGSARLVGCVPAWQSSQAARQPGTAFSTLCLCVGLLPPCRAGDDIRVWMDIEDPAERQVSTAQHSSAAGGASQHTHAHRPSQPARPPSLNLPSSFLLVQAKWDWALDHEQIVFARVSPAHKLLIVENCQRRGACGRGEGASGRQGLRAQGQRSFALLLPGRLCADAAATAFLTPPS